MGPQHSFCGTLRTNLSIALHGKGRSADAIAQLERAQDITERALGPEHAQLGTIAIDIGNILLEQGKVAEAAAQFKRASEIWTGALGADHPNVATALFRGGEIDPLVAIGKAQVALGKPRLAAVQLDRALGLANAQTDPLDVASGRFAIAQVLIGIDAGRARTLAAQAHAAFVAAGADHAHDADTAARWLAAHE